MQGNSSVRTAGFAAGFGVLLFVLILVVCITTGVLPLRESYAQDPGPGQLPPALTATPTPTPGNTDPEVTPTPTPTPTPEATPEPTEPPVETPAPTPGTLEEEKPTFTITVTFSKGGTAIPYGMSAVVENGSIEIVAVPNEGYAVESFVLDGKDLGPLTAYTLENVTENHSIYIAFTRAIFAPNVTPNPGTAMGEADTPE